jgi:hypothetical protein
MSLQKIAHQKVEKLSVFSTKFDEMTLLSSSLMNRFRYLMRWRFHSLNLKSRSQRVWWDVSSILMTSHHKRRLTNREQQVENRHTSLDKSRINIRYSIIENKHASFVKNEIERSKKLTMKLSNMITKTNRFKQS